MRFIWMSVLKHDSKRWKVEVIIEEPGCRRWSLLITVTTHQPSWWTPEPGWCASYSPEMSR